VIEALKTDYIKIILFILRIIDKEERKSYAQSVIGLARCSQGAFI
jgi:hypothetical protein